MNIPEPQVRLAQKLIRLKFFTKTKKKKKNQIGSLLQKLSETEENSPNRQTVSLPSVYKVIKKKTNQCRRCKLSIMS
jgi:hypothetical protein